MLPHLYRSPQKPVNVFLILYKHGFFKITAYKELQTRVCKNHKTSSENKNGAPVRNYKIFTKKMCYNFRKLTGKNTTKLGKVPLTLTHRLLTVHIWTRTPFFEKNCTLGSSKLVFAPEYPHLKFYDFLAQLFFNYNDHKDFRSSDKN